MLRVRPWLFLAGFKQTRFRLHRQPAKVNNRLNAEG